MSHLDSPIFSEDDTQLYRFAFLAADELIRRAREWRNLVEQQGHSADFAKAKEELRLLVENLDYRLAPYTSNGLFIDRPAQSDESWKSLPSIQQVQVGIETETARNGFVSAFGFSERSAHQAVYEFGEATREAMEFLTGAGGHATTLNYMLSASSTLRTETLGLGLVAKDEAIHATKECLWEAEQAWKRTNSPAENGVIQSTPPGLGSTGRKRKRQQQNCVADDKEDDAPISRGRKPAAQEQQDYDRRLEEAWLTRRYRFLEELATEKGITKEELVRARDRHRQRVKKAKQRGKN